MPYVNKLHALEEELVTLRNRVQFLERQLNLTGRCYSGETGCQMDRKPDCGDYRSKYAFCQEAHTIRSCQYYRLLQVGDQWSVAKKSGLCYRCLDNTDRHLGRNCPNSRVCRIRWCRRLHHRLLHDPNTRLYGRRKLRASREVQHSVLSPSHRLIHDCNSSLQTDRNVTCDGEDNDMNVSETHSMGILALFNEHVISEGQLNFMEGPSGYVNDADSLTCSDENPHVGANIACDGEVVDSQQMEELNRLAMLAEREVPFEMIFSGSCRNRSQSVHREYVNPFSSSFDNIEEHIPDHNHECGENNSG